MTAGTCELCGREMPALTVHHLIPRSRHANKRTKARFDYDERVGTLAKFCSPCHKQVHAILDEKTLERDYNTIEALLAHPEIARFVAWIAKRPANTKVQVRRRRGRR